MSIKLSDDRYQAALKRQRARVAKGIPLRMVDSNATGDKHTSASWGLCSDDRDAWPDAQDHLWPDQFTDRGRVAPKYFKPHQVCPFDARINGDAPPSNNGCFYTCRLFQPRYPTPSRDEALALYDALIT